LISSFVRQQVDTRNIIQVQITLLLVTFGQGNNLIHYLKTVASREGLQCSIDQRKKRKNALSAHLRGLFAVTQVYNTDLIFILTAQRYLMI